ncbi:exported hypothetical protein [Planktothrix sp. PCC 11201]|nr:exported hypothetical protein [Planktothrix sp. PCC 11201]
MGNIVIKKVDNRISFSLSLCLCALVVIGVNLSNNFIVFILDQIPLNPH